MKYMIIILGCTVAAAWIAAGYLVRKAGKAIRRSRGYTEIG